MMETYAVFEQLSDTGFVTLGITRQPNDAEAMAYFNDMASIDRSIVVISLTGNLTSSTFTPINQVRLASR